VTSWENYDVHQECLGAEGDQGDILVIKSGTDFRDLTSIDLELGNVPETTDGAVRRKLIKSIKGMSLKKYLQNMLRRDLRTTARDKAGNASISKSQGSPQVRP
jgi:hypothetical protein